MTSHQLIAQLEAQPYEQFARAASVYEIFQEAPERFPDAAARIFLRSPADLASESRWTFTELLARVIIRGGHNIDPAVMEEVLAAAAVPKRIIVISDMPTTAAGKIFKPELRRQAAEAVFRERVKDLSGVDVKAILDARAGLLVQVMVDASHDDPTA